MTPLPVGTTRRCNRHSSDGQRTAGALVINDLANYSEPTDPLTGGQTSEATLFNAVSVELTFVALRATKVTQQADFRLLLYRASSTTVGRADFRECAKTPGVARVVLSTDVAFGLACSLRCSRLWWVDFFAARHGLSAIRCRHFKQKRHGAQPDSPRRRVDRSAVPIQRRSRAKKRAWPGIRRQWRGDWARSRSPLR